MAKLHATGAALIAAAMAVAGCCDKCKEGAKTAPAEQESVKAAPAAEVAAPAAGVAAPAAEAAAADPAEAVMSIGDVKMTRAELDATVDRFLETQKDAIPPERLDFAKMQLANVVLQEFIAEHVFAKKARELGYEATPEELKAREEELVKSFAGRPNAPKSIAEAVENHPLGKERAMASFVNGVVIDKMVKGEIESKDAKDYTEDAQKIIEGIKQGNAGLKNPEEALAKIKELKAQLDETPEAERAAKFAELAKAESACPSSRKGGDLGEFTHGMMVPEFDQVAFAQEVGEISGPVKTQFGYHLILTTKKTPAVEATDDAPASPEKVQASHILIKTEEPREVPELEQVVKVLRQEANKNKIQEFMIDLIRKAGVTTSKDFKYLLPPPETPAEGSEAGK